MGKKRRKRRKRNKKRAGIENLDLSIELKADLVLLASSLFAISLPSKTIDVYNRVIHTKGIVDRLVSKVSLLESPLPGEDAESYPDVQEVTQDISPAELDDLIEKATNREISLLEKRFLSHGIEVLVHSERRISYAKDLPSLKERLVKLSADLRDFSLAVLLIDEVLPKITEPELETESRLSLEEKLSRGNSIISREMSSNKYKRTVFCCGCGTTVEPRFTNADEIYPHRPDLTGIPLWKCDACGNYVGCRHKLPYGKNWMDPIGPIPTPEIRKAREEVYSLTIPITWGGEITRQQLYKKLGEELGIRKYRTAKIRSLEQAKKACKLLREYAEHGITLE